MTGEGREGRCHSTSRRYEDTGCELAPSCLNCPFPFCFKHEGEGESLRVKQHYSDLQKAYRIRDLIPEEAAQELGVGVRTVYRILKRVRTYQKQEV